MRAFLTLFAFLVATLFAAPWMPTLDTVMTCVRSNVWPSRLILLHLVSDSLIAISYTWIPLVLVLQIWRRLRAKPATVLLVLFGAFIVLCGITHAMSVVTIWTPIYWLDGKIKAVTALVSIAVAVVLTRLAPEIVALGELGSVAETARRSAEAKAEEALRRADELAAANDMVRRQERAIAELSLPILDVAPGVLLVPLVGMLDSKRAADLQDRVGVAIEAMHAQVIIVDVTGIPLVDTAVANSLAMTAAMARLQGCACILTGIRSAVAQTMVSAGIELEGIRTAGTLRDGLHIAVRGERRTT